MIIGLPQSFYRRDHKEARSRSEQHGWSKAKGKAQPPQSGGGFSLSRSEAVRREQAQRDNCKALSSMIHGGERK